MAEPTLQEIFGINATQTATTITLTKADFAAIGLTASATNRGEQLLVAVILKAREKLNETNQTADPDIQVTIEPGFETLVTRNSIQYRQKNYTIQLEKPDASAVIDPDDF